MRDLSRIVLILTALLAFSEVYAACDCGANCTGESITQQSGSNTITFQFSAPATCGQWANGDFWVLAPVTISAMSPAAAQGKNGWLVNPTSGRQSYDSQMDQYDPSLMPGLPYLAQGGESIVKTISRGTCSGNSNFNCLNFATVLTVVSEVPLDNGSAHFRPPYFGQEKPQHSTARMQTDLLPSLRGTGSSIPSLAEAEARFRWVQLDHGSNNYRVRQMIPSDNFDSSSWTNISTSEYGAEIARDTADVALRLMLDDPLPNKLPALINYVQAGIDYFYTMKGGKKWQAEAGLFLGRKLPPVFAATILDDSSMKSLIQSKSGRNLNPTGPSSHQFNTWSEDGQIYYSSDANNGRGMVLWGERSYFHNIASYEDNLVDLSATGSNQHADPYGTGYIDGGKPWVDGGNYQFCCTSALYKATALSLVLMPSLQNTWNNPDFVTYADRWVNHGAWLAPDPRNRNPQGDGAYRNGGYGGSPFANGMWSAYRDGYAATGPRPPVLIIGD